MSHQEKAVDKLSGLKVAALYMDTGTGKTRTALELDHIN
jgi:type I site-specific restriction endonuclease